MVEREKVGVEDLDDDEQLEELRRLILEPEQEQLKEILRSLGDANHQAREIGGVLPAAIRHSNSEGPELEKALAPSFEKATHLAIRKDRKAFADALFPVMGPAIRKSISEALKGLIQSLNQALEHSLSWKGLKWRIEALRTGRSFAEIVLSKTLVYRVEQVVLIHRESGLLLMHVVAPEVDAEDADMVSGMLTAIQDFVRDSFRIEGEESLQTMEIGDLQVWVEQGPQAGLAAAIRGDARVELRQKMREVVEATHLEMQSELADFEGDASDFEKMRPLVEECLESKAVEEEKKTSPLLWGFSALLLLVVGWWLFSNWQADRALASYLAALEDSPGIVVTQVDEVDGGVVVRGLRDPLAADPQEIAGGLDMSRFHVRSSFQSYVSLYEPFVLERAQRVLRPPPTVVLELNDGILRASGVASPEWISRCRQISIVLPGVTEYSDEAVESKDAALLEEMRKIEVLKTRIEGQSVHFDVASSEIGDQQASQLAETINDITEMIRSAETTFQIVRVLVEGHADSSGSPEINVRLSRERAEAVTNLLEAGGIPPRLIRAVGRGALISAEGDTNSGVLGGQRRVSFIVEIKSHREERNE